MNDNRILFVDLDGTLIKEDLSNLAFVDFLKKNLFCFSFICYFLFKGNLSKEKISTGFECQ